MTGHHFCDNTALWQTSEIGVLGGIYTGHHWQISGIEWWTDSVGLTEDKLFVVGSEKLLDVNQRLNRLALIGFDSIVIILVVQVWHQGDRRGEPHVGHSARRRSQPHVHAQFPLTAPWGLRHTCPAHHRPHDAGNHSASWRGKAKPTRWVTGN